MKSLFSIALLADATQARRRSSDFSLLAHCLQLMGSVPHVFLLMAEPEDFIADAQDVYFHPVVSQPCPFGVDEQARQRVQEMIDALLDEQAQSAKKYDIYHAQDIISATALTMMQGMGFIDEFIYTVSDGEFPDTPYLESCQVQALRAANQCLCLSEKEQEALRAKYGIQAHVLTAPPRSRVQRRRLRDRQANLPTDWQQDPWQDLAYQHWLVYEQQLSHLTLLRYA